MKKRHAFPVTVLGDEYHVRPLTFGELLRLDKLDDIRRTWFVLGCGMAESDGSPSFTPVAEGVPDSEWCDQVGKAFVDTEGPVISELAAAITKITKPANEKAIEKNS